uniref:Uncharacterized protein LOC111131605 n=1 Tax=Crassostrea virginica TaxID=6565 RepID=A0A8B8E5D7_CRAVI|nr:uncharacterized protein LOC111131605 [Crassostrea virginica]
MNTTNTTHTIREETTRQGPNNPANNISSSPQNHVDMDAKSMNADVSETDDQNNDTHSYLTISDRSDRLYAAVHYDEAEDRKSSSPISLRSIKEHYGSESDNSKASESYLTPLINDVEELKGDSPRSSDYEDVTTFRM